MKFFLKQVHLFTLFSVILFSVITACFLYVNELTFKDIPAPYLSNHAHYNEKLRFLRNTNIEPEILVAGSSMGVSNFHSEALTNELKTSAHLNISSQALTLEFIYPLVKIMIQNHQPEMLILSTNLYEFSNRHLITKNNLIEDYLSGKGADFLYHLRTFNLSYYINNFYINRDRRKNISSGFDNHGTINRGHGGFDDEPDEEQVSIRSVRNYEYLYKLAEFCKQHDIKLVVVQSPFRDGVFSTIAEEELQYLNDHIKKIETITDTHEFMFINTLDRKWEDELFSTSTHFNVYGAEKFTKYIIDYIYDQM